MISMFKRKASGGRRAGVAVSSDRVAVAVVERDGDRLRLTHCAVHELDGSDWARRTADATSSLELKRVPVTAVVEDDAYQLVLVECPQVPAEEVADAVRWRIKDLVAFPTEDAVIDTIDIPPLANQSNRPMIYAVAAQADAVERQVDAVTGAGMRLDAIDIPEMCLRNVAAALPDAQFGVALLHLESDHGTLILWRGGALYLIRRIDVGLDAVHSVMSGQLAVGDAVSDIALEVQRSLDYFESHYDQRPINKVVLGPGTPDGFATKLGEELGVDVSAFDLDLVVSASPEAAGVDDGATLMAIGAALRGDAQGAAA